MISLDFESRENTYALLMYCISLFHRESSRTTWQLTHLLDNSWLPLGIRGARFLTMLNTLFWFKFGLNTFIFIFTLIGTIVLVYIWFRDISREGAFQGQHTLLVQASLKWGLIWFLFREVWFFFRVFWRFFHTRIAPLSSGRHSWPYIGLRVIPPFQVPLLNTLILLIRGLTATLGHQEILGGLNSNWILVRVVLGLYFLSLQGVEYIASSFSMASGSYGRVFFFGTGFHGLHVCLGAVILAVRSIRILRSLISSQHHFGLEFSLWYWHFVDVVWLFLFFWIYTWGS
jgi:cytochrome c oxidase subunit 3